MQFKIITQQFAPVKQKIAVFYEIFADFSHASPFPFAFFRRICYTARMRTLTLMIEPQYDGCSVRDLLHKTLHVSDGLCSRLKRQRDALLLDGAPVYVTEAVHAGQTLSVQVGDPQKDPRIRPMPLPLAIVYEDEDLLVIDKPNGLAVHPARDPNEVTLENALAAYLGGTDNPHPVSRLDRGTTGLMTVAKSGWAHSLMKAVQHAGGMQKTYLALTVGAPPSPFGVIDAPIGPAEGSTYKREVRADGAPARSRYEVLRVENGLALMRLVPETGRTHQLRVHMAYLGCPLLGDWLYGARDPRIDRPALHAAALTFTHPLTGEAIALHAPLPEDFTRLTADDVSFGIMRSET